ncbi:hypothetical protein DUI87_22578 [Hirundo rustica rustica]|uniref:Arrestin-like N-terminal domain-containing protein n=1 Tax=Hirundo rustica rustica TaxID=333673 RepID=A0A3M0JIF9_HIRRU|nr:hypothetical protein DUI87_22578 [Hirundo rustica rustica]
MRPPGRVRRLAVRLEDGPARGGGELLHGRVQLELRGPLRVRALEVCARGMAAVHWLESRSVGLNVVYRDYSACQTFLYRRRQLIPGPLVSLRARWGEASRCQQRLGEGAAPAGRAGSGSSPARL